MGVTLTNLIPYPSMENAGWTGPYSTDHAYSGNYSISLNGTASTPEVTANTLDAIPLISSHIYYARVYGYQDAQTGGSVGFYWPIAEPSFQEGIPIGSAGQWNLYSGRNVRSSFSSGNYQLRLDYNNSYLSGSMYFDGAMLIDLTAGFGSGNEPSKEWCDANIPYFEGSKSFDFYIVTIPEIVSASFSPNPASINQSTVLSVQVNDQAIVLAPENFQSNEIYSGEAS